MGMTYCEMITASKTWTCPKAGRWKIICVGGGASGGIGNPLTQNAGGTTSFGSLLSALGGKKSTIGTSVRDIGGEGGYTGLNYGGAGAIVASSSNYCSGASLNGGQPAQAGIGYGAGGGAKHSSFVAGGKCGELKIIELDLTLNQSIACTVGLGGAAVSEDSYGGTAGNSGVIIVRFIQ